MTASEHNDQGRWPANLCHDGSDEVLAEFPAKAGAAAPASGPTHTGLSRSGSMAGAMNGMGDRDPAFHSDTGSAARFFYCAKASKADRNEGLDGQRIVTLEFATWGNVGQKVALRVATEQSHLKVIGVSGTPCENLIEWNNALFGSANGVKFHPDTTSTTEIEINSTILSIISNCLPKCDTNENTADANRSMVCGKSLAENAVSGTPRKVITNEKTAYLLGVGPAVFKTLLKISVEDGRSSHPTVKPSDLMRWLCRLVTPPGGTVFDPFTGSGSTGKAALLEGFQFVGCEMTPEYATIARARLDHASLSVRGGH